MACKCSGLDREALLEAVRQLFAAKLKAAFDGRRIGCTATAGSHWYTGTWDGSRWSGHNHVLHGDYTLLSCDGSTITATIVFHIEDTGTYEDNH